VASGQTTLEWQHEADDLARGVGGGMLFGIPLMYTMEVWWLGGATRPGQTLLALLVGFVPVTLIVHSAGFRHEDDQRLAHSLMDGVEAIALGLVVSAILLFVLGEIGPGTPPAETLGKLVYESVPFSVGVAVARSVFGGSRSGATAKKGKRGGASRTPAQATLADLGATMVGAVFVAFNIAPTDEIPMLAAATSAPRLLGIVGVSLLASYVIVFVAGIGDQDSRTQQEGMFQHPVTETIVAYLVALVGGIAMLWFFQRLDGPLLSVGTMTEVLVLGLPAAVGGAAGRLAV
jgi:putative integral membrane protein (TIGR02587 family)